MKKKTLVIGASENPERYSYKAVNKLTQFGHPVVALGRTSGKINEIPIETGFPKFQEIDTVSIYLSPENQDAVMEYIFSLQTKRIIFNPGTENKKWEEKAAAESIEVVEGCTLVMLSTQQF
ncbi:MAG: CoA-binding protein [Bdellovibrionaceae bacterium]|nr:CoA-binding protein [Pseudobdellovibrionaceae bacterium]